MGNIINILANDENTCLTNHSTLSKVDDTICDECLYDDTTCSDRITANQTTCVYDDTTCADRITANQTTCVYDDTTCADRITANQTTCVYDDTTCADRITANKLTKSQCKSEYDLMSSCSNSYCKSAFNLIDSADHNSEQCKSDFDLVGLSSSVYTGDQCRAKGCEAGTVTYTFGEQPESDFLMKDLIMAQYNLEDTTLGWVRIVAGSDSWTSLYLAYNSGGYEPIPYTSVSVVRNPGDPYTVTISNDYIPESFTYKQYSLMEIILLILVIYLFVLVLQRVSSPGIRQPL